MSTPARARATATSFFSFKLLGILGFKATPKIGPSGLPSNALIPETPNWGPGAFLIIESGSSRDSSLKCPNSKAFANNTVIKPGIPPPSTQDAGISVWKKRRSLEF